MAEPVEDGCNAVACHQRIAYYRCPERPRCAAALHLRQRGWRVPVFTQPPWPDEEDDE